MESIYKGQESNKKCPFKQSIISKNNDTTFPRVFHKEVPSPNFALLFHFRGEEMSELLLFIGVDVGNYLEVRK